MAHGTLQRSDALRPHLAARAVDEGLPYFNTGVLVMDLDQFRAHRVGPVCLEFILEHRVRFADQDALNLFLAGRIKALDPRWNQQHTVHEMEDAWILGTRGMPTSAGELAHLREAPFVVHYTSQKPWNVGHRAMNAAYFFDVLDRTPWSGWRPTRLHRALRRLERLVDTCVGPRLVPH